LPKGALRAVEPDEMEALSSNRCKPSAMPSPVSDAGLFQVGNDDVAAADFLHPRDDLFFPSVAPLSALTGNPATCIPWPRWS